MKTYSNNSPTFRKLQQYIGTESVKLRIKLCFLLTTYCLLQLPTYTYSQGVAINTTGAVANPSSMLDVSSIDKGVLIPRMNTAQRSTIASPAQGLLIYNTTTQCFEFYENSSWYSLGCTCTLPDIPECTAGSGATATQITANWNAATGAASYSLDVSTVSDFSSFVAGYNDLNVGAVTTYDVTGLTCNTTYYYRIKAVNSCGTTGSSNTITYTTAACFACGSPFTDSRDSKSYNTVLIGSQCWMAQNLDVGTYVSGGTTQTSGADNYNTSIEKYCYNNNVANCTTYGGLYQWAEAMSYLNGATNTTSWSPVPTGDVQGICPAGWHIPTDTEWMTLEEFLGMCAGAGAGCSGSTAYRGTNEGGKLKEAGTTHWSPSNTCGGTCNTSGFTALPGAIRTVGAAFLFLGNYGYWLLASEETATSTWLRRLDYDYAQVYRFPNSKNAGYSVRCIKN